MDGVTETDSQTLNPHTPTVHSNTTGYVCTDKVYSPSDSSAAPSTSDMRKIVMPDLFDMKR